MISQAENVRLCRVGPGTPMGATSGTSGLPTDRLPVPGAAPLPTGCSARSSWCSAAATWQGRHPRRALPASRRLAGAGPGRGLRHPLHLARLEVRQCLPNLEIMNNPANKRLPNLKAGLDLLGPNVRLPAPHFAFMDWPRQLACRTSSIRPTRPGWIMGVGALAITVPSSRSRTRSSAITRAFRKGAPGLPGLHHAERADHSRRSSYRAPATILLEVPIDDEHGDLHRAQGQVPLSVQPRLRETGYVEVYSAAGDRPWCREPSTCNGRHHGSQLVRPERHRLRGCGNRHFDGTTPWPHEGHLIASWTARRSRRSTRPCPPSRPLAFSAARHRVVGIAA